MKPAPFSYHRAVSLDDAIASLAGAAGMAKVLAGGQSLVPMLNLRLAPLDHVVDIAAIGELATAEPTADGVRYGALVRHAAFEDGLVPDVSNGLMAAVAAGLAYRAIRTRGTIGGSLALADPAADWLTVAVALEARLDIAGPDGRRTVPVAEFVVGPYFTVLEDCEIIAAVTIGRRPGSERWGTYKVTRKVGEYANSLSVVLLDRSRGTARVVLGAIDTAPLVMSATADAILAGAEGCALKAVIEAELSESGCGFAPASLRMHAACVERAAMKAAA